MPWLKGKFMSGCANGVVGKPVQASTDSPLERYLRSARSLTLDEIRRVLPTDHRASGGLYGLMLDYPLRGGKALRPALCIATCRALGGKLSSVLRTAAVLELYHNAFLIHDDVEDGSDRRRAEATLHHSHGTPIAVNVGDGLLAVCMGMLFENVETIGLGRSLRLFQLITRMARETAEGQMVELNWTRLAAAAPSDRDYVEMVYRKTAWYSFITPMQAGAIAASRQVDRELHVCIHRLAAYLGIAFQIRDDLLNLEHTDDGYGKEFEGDLWEGKYTLMLIHALRAATATERRDAFEILKKPRVSNMQALARAVQTGIDDAQLTRRQLDVMEPALQALATGACAKTEDDVRFLRGLIDRADAIGYATGAAERHARRAERQFASFKARSSPSLHLDFIENLVDFVVTRST